MLKKQKIHKKTPLFSLINRFIFFLFGLSFLVFLLYVGGNWQNFLDENQMMLLNILRTLSIFLFMFIIVGLTLLIWYLFNDRKYFYIKYVIMYVIYAIISLCFFMLSNLVVFFSR